MDLLTITKQCLIKEDLEFAGELLRLYTESSKNKAVIDKLIDLITEATKPVEGKENCITVDNATKEEQLNQPDTEVYSLQDYIDSKKKVESNPPNVLIEFNQKKLSSEKQLILLTIAWCKRPSMTTYICKQAQRLAYYFNLDKDPRWSQTDKWGKCKMRSDLVGVLHRLKYNGYLTISEDPNNSNSKLYYLSSLGLETSQIISNLVNFNPFDTAI